MRSQSTIIIGPCQKSRIELYLSRHTTSFQRLSGSCRTPLTSYRHLINVKTTSCVYWDETEQLFFKTVVLKKFPGDNMCRNFFKRDNNIGMYPNILRRLLEDILQKLTKKVTPLGSFIDVSNSGWKNLDKTIHFFPCSLVSLFAQVDLKEKVEAELSYNSKNVPLWSNAWVFVYELSGCGFESRYRNNLVSDFSVCLNFLCIRKRHCLNKRSGYSKTSSNKWNLLKRKTKICEAFRFISDKGKPQKNGTSFVV